MMKIHEQQSTDKAQSNWKAIQGRADFRKGLKKSNLVCPGTPEEISPAFTKWMADAIEYIVNATGLITLKSRCMAEEKEAQLQTLYKHSSQAVYIEARMLPKTKAIHTKRLNHKWMPQATIRPYLLAAMGFNQGLFLAQTHELFTEMALTEFNFQDFTPRA